MALKGSHIGGWILKSGQCIDIRVEVLWRGGAIPGLGWCDCQELEFIPVVTV